MSTLVTYNGVQYTVPAYQDTGWAQGTGNLSSYLIALATGSLQQTGGAFTLTSEVDFGASFGLKSLYYKSRTANPASTGQIRLAKTDTIDWRNNANSGDLPLGINGSDQLTYNGSVVQTGTGFVTSIIGTTNQIIASSPTGAVTLSTPQDIGVASSVTFGQIIDSGLTANTALTANGSKQLTSSVTTATELGFVSGVTSAIQTQLNGKQNTLTLPLSVSNGGTGDSSLTAYAVLAGGTTSTGAVQSVAGLGTSGQVLTSNGAGALPTFQAVSGSGTVNSGTAGDLAYYATSSNAVSDAGTASVTAGNITLANQSSGLFLKASQAVSAAAVSELIENTSAAGSGARTTLQVNANDAVGAYTNYRIAASTAFSIGLRLGGVSPLFQIINGADFSGSTALSIGSGTGDVSIRGAGTNSNALAGFVGEYVTANNAVGVNSTGNGQWFDIVSISLTAGDWDVSGTIGFNLAGATATQCSGGMSVTTGNSATGLTFGDNWLETVIPTAVTDSSVSIPGWRRSLSTTTTIYLKANLAFSLGTPNAYGRISARRVR